MERRISLLVASGGVMAEVFRAAGPRLVALTCLMLASPVLAQEAQPMKVGVLTLAQQAVPQSIDLPGRAVAYEQVGVRPRVDGVVEKILYTPGKPLAVGDPLFQLDDAAYVASVASDQASVAQAEADLPVKQAAYDRALKLEGQGYTTAEVESAQSDLASAKATLDAARAALNYAQTELSWTTILSPIEGIPEVAAVSVGDLVTAGQDSAMTTVTRLDPIYVDMLEPSARLLVLRKKIESGLLSPNEKLNATLILEDGETYTGSGALVSPSATVSTSTGTVSMRFEFENGDRKILPGMFLRGTVEFGTMQAFLVPQRATERDATTGALTAYVVGDDGKAAQVSFSSEAVYRNSWVVTEGLAEGQQLILDGLKTMAAGTAVEAVPAEIDENGLVKDLAASGDGAPESGAPADAQAKD